MTKFQWEQEMNKYLSALPKEERRKILEYYGELFLDKFENGEREEYIIAGFGEPSAVAIDILKNYDNSFSGADDLNTHNFVNMPQPTPSTSGNGGNYGTGINANPAFAANGYNANNAGGNAASGNGGNYGTGINANPAFNANGYNTNGRPIDNTVGSGNIKKEKNTVLLNKTLKIILFAFLCVSVGIPVLSTVFSLCVALLATTFSLATCSLAGIACLFVAIVESLPAAHSLILVGTGVFLTGFGLIFIPLFTKSIKLVIKLSKYISIAVKKVTIGFFV